MTAHHAPPALPPERIDELKALLRATNPLGAQWRHVREDNVIDDDGGARLLRWQPTSKDVSRAEFEAIGDLVVAAVNSLPSLLAATKRLGEAEKLMREIASGIRVGSHCHRTTKTIYDPTDVEDMTVARDAGEPGSCGVCLSCRVVAFLSPAPATATEETR